MDIREDIEDMIGEYCDGTIHFRDGKMEYSLDGAHFIEYFTNESHSPQELADRIVKYIEEYKKG